MPKINLAPAIYIAFSDCGQFVRFWTRSKMDMQAQQLATPDMKIVGFYAEPVADADELRRLQFELTEALASRDVWQQQAEDRLKDWDDMRKQGEAMRVQLYRVNAEKDAAVRELKLAREQKPVHWRAVCLEHPESRSRIMSSDSEETMRRYALERKDFQGWDYKVEPLYASPAPTTLPVSQGVPEEWYEAATELASYASYAQIVGAISHNSSVIRKWCDVVFDLKRKHDDAEFVAEVQEEAHAILASKEQSS